MSVRTSTLLSRAAVAVSLAMCACAARQPSAMHDDAPRLASTFGPPGMVRADAMPPSPIVEEMTLAPDEDMVWVDGYWHWAGSDWLWVDGRWTYPPEGYVYVEPYYDWYGGYCDYLPGYWDHPGQIPGGAIVVRDHRDGDSFPTSVRIPSRRGGDGGGDQRPMADIVRDHRGDGDRPNERVPVDYDADIYRPHADIVRDHRGDDDRPNERVPVDYDADIDHPQADVVRDHRQQPEPVVVTQPGAADAPTHVIVIYPNADGTFGGGATTTTTYPTQPVGGVVVTPPVRTRSTYNPPATRTNTTNTSTIAPPPRRTTTKTHAKPATPPAKTKTTGVSAPRHKAPARRHK